MASGITLSDPYLKTARAKEHLDALRQELNSFHESKPCQFVSQDDVKYQRCRVAVKIRDAPDRISLIAGDVFYNLRAALDQLVWCLAKLTSAYPKNTQFPILEERDVPRFERQTSGVPAEAAAIIELLQPYNGGDVEAIRSHTLWRLNKMCIIDKHMRIPTHSIQMNFPLPASLASLINFENDGVMNIPLSHKAELKSHMKLNPEVSFKVVFGDSHLGIECDFEGIETIYDLVANKVIPRFARFFQ